MHVLRPSCFFMRRWASSPTKSSKAACSPFGVDGTRASSLGGRRARWLRPHLLRRRAHWRLRRGRSAFRLGPRGSCCRQGGHAKRSLSALGRLRAAAALWRTLSVRLFGSRRRRGQLLPRLMGASRRRLRRLAPHTPMRLEVDSPTARPARLATRTRARPHRSPRVRRG